MLLRVESIERDGRREYGDAVRTPRLRRESQHREQEGYSPHGGRKGESGPGAGWEGGWRVKFRIALDARECQTTHGELDDPQHLCVWSRTDMSEPFRIAFIGIDHPHGAAWRELFPHVGVPVEVAAIVPAFGGAVASLEEKYARVPRFKTVDQLLVRR